MTAMARTQAAPTAMARSRPEVKAVRAACVGHRRGSYEIPAALPPLPISAGWHARSDADPEHRWLRAQVQDIASELAGTAASSARVQSR
jgi:hypothetical protein